MKSYLGSNLTRSGHFSDEFVRGLLGLPVTVWWFVTRLGLRVRRGQGLPGLPDIKDIWIELRGHDCAEDTIFTALVSSFVPSQLWNRESIAQRQLTVLIPKETTSSFILKLYEAFIANSVPLFWLCWVLKPTKETTAQTKRRLTTTGDYFVYCTTALRVIEKRISEVIKRRIF